MKREYRGPPIDLREQYITERPAMSDAPTRDENGENGETVAGTSPDDFFSESTDNIPTHLDAGEIPEDELQAIGWALSVSISHAANQMERFSPTDIKRIVDRYLDDDDIARIKDYDHVPSIPLDDLSEKQREAAEAYMSHPDFPDVTPKELASEGDFKTKTAERAIHTAFPATRSFDDLRGEIQMGILIWAHEGIDSNLTDVREKYLVNNRAIGDARRIYPDLIEEKQPVYGPELEDALADYKKNRSVSKSGSDDSLKEEPKRSPEKKLKEDKGYDDLTTKQKSIVDELTKSPGDVATNIADRLEVDYSSVYAIVRDFPHIVKEQIEKESAVDSVDDIHENILDKAEDLGEWDIGEEADEPEIEPPLESEVEIEFEEEVEFDVDDDLNLTPTIETPFMERRETVVFLSGELSRQAAEHIDTTDEYSSVTQLARDAIRKEMNGEYDAPTETKGGNVQTDTIEAVIELADVEPAKADAIRTLISNE